MWKYHMRKRKTEEYLWRAALKKVLNDSTSLMTPPPGKWSIIPYHSNIMEAKKETDIKRECELNSVTHLWIEHAGSDEMSLSWWGYKIPRLLSQEASVLHAWVDGGGCHVGRPMWQALGGPCWGNWNSHLGTESCWKLLERGQKQMFPHSSFQMVLQPLLKPWL